MLWINIIKGRKRLKEIFIKAWFINKWIIILKPYIKLIFFYYKIWSQNATSRTIKILKITNKYLSIHPHNSMNSTIEFFNLHCTLMVTNYGSSLMVDFMVENLVSRFPTNVHIDMRTATLVDSILNPMRKRWMISQPLLAPIISCMFFFFIHCNLFLLLHSRNIQHIQMK